jgi:alpha-galactosidase
MTDRRTFLKGTTALTIAGASLGLPAAIAGIDGTWEVTIGKLADGRNLNAYFVIRQQGRRLTGNAIHYGMDFALRNGKIEGNRFTFEDLATVEGRFENDQLVFTANYGDDAPYSQVLDNSYIMVPSVPRGVRDKFVARRVPPGTEAPPPRIELPATRKLPSNGLVPTPPMVWGAWYGFTIAITDPLIREMADALIKSGLRDAGFNVLNMEVGWTGQRDASGRLTANPKFPDIKGLADYVHSRGFKLGICTSPGPIDCTGYIGSHGHEEQDAKTFAEWGIDYIKHDMCSANAMYKPEEEQRLYQKMGAALQASGRPIVYSLCQYGEAEVWRWGADTGGNLWRVSSDVYDTWESVSYIGFGLGDLAGFARPGHWNDFDYLMVGLGNLTDDEYRTQMTQWCMHASPLITSVDPRQLSPLEKEILLNKELIAVDQDARGIAGRRVARRGKTEIWTRPVAGGHAVALYNLGDAPATVTLEPAKLGIASAVNVRDLWKHEDVSLDRGRLNVRLPRHGSAVFRITT